MGRKRAPRYLGVLAVLLGLALVIATFAVAAGEEPPPAPRLEKLDAFLGGLLSRQEASVQTTLVSRSTYGPSETGGTQDNSFPLHTYGDGGIGVEVLIKTDGSLEGLNEAWVTIESVVGMVVVGHLPLSALGKLTSLSNVEYIEAARWLWPSNDMSVPITGAPQFRTRTGVDGSGVIIGIIDTGVDFTHPDFLKPDGTTRIKFICDMTDPPQTGEDSCGGKGTLWTEGQINDALVGSGDVRQRDTRGHGTHVLGSAAGGDQTYGGMAPGADIIVVKAGDTSFSTSNIIRGMSFIDEKATSLGRPYVINMSFGGHIGPHDGTDQISTAIGDLTGPGKVVVVAAGNEGDEFIHAGGDVSLAPQTVTFNVSPKLGGIFLDVWYDGQDSLTFGFEFPDGTLNTLRPGGSFLDVQS